MKKWALLFLACIVSFACLTACGKSSPPNKKRIAQNLLKDIVSDVIYHPFDDVEPDACTLDISKVTIDKRQTNEKMV